MKEITIKQVEQAYKKTGIKPLRRLFFCKKTDGSICGCPLTAIAVANGLPICELEKVEGTVATGRKVFSKLMELGYEPSYLQEFVMGVDDGSPAPPPAGRAAGVAIVLKLWNDGKI